MQMIGQVECKWVGKSVQLPSPKTSFETANSYQWLEGIVCGFG